ncbi:MAG: response regulator transcription factor [Halioglobus sp.]
MNAIKFIQQSNQELPHPGVWATCALNAESREAAWETLEESLAGIGFENCYYLSEVSGNNPKLASLAQSWTIPVTDRRKGTLSVLVIDCTGNQKAQQELVEKYRPYLMSCVLYFREGLEVRHLLAQAGHSLLSQREADCMALTAAGRSTKEIGALMGIAVSTANEYISHAINKLGATNRAQASARAMLAGCFQASAQTYTGDP